nr:hypothetical protein [Tanacetum cinerariifolium]
MDSKKNIVDLEAFRDMLHISPRVSGQSFDELPFEEEILDFLWFLGHSAQKKTFTDVNTSGTPRLKRSIMLVPLEKQHQSERLVPEGKEVVLIPPPLLQLLLTATAKGKQPARATSPYDPSEVERTEAKQLKIVLRKSRQETHISQHGGSSTDEGTGSKLGVLDVPSDDSKEEISWNSSDDEDVDAQDKGRDEDEGKKNDKSDAGKDDDDDDQDDAERDDDDDDDDDEEE